MIFRSVFGPPDCPEEYSDRVSGSLWSRSYYSLVYFEAGFDTAHVPSGSGLIILSSGFRLGLAVLRSLGDQVLLSSGLFWTRSEGPSVQYCSSSSSDDHFMEHRVISLVNSVVIHV